MGLTTLAPYLLETLSEYHIELLEEAGRRNGDRRVDVVGVSVNSYNCHNINILIKMGVLAVSELLPFLNGTCERYVLYTKNITEQDMSEVIGAYRDAKANDTLYELSCGQIGIEHMGEIYRPILSLM